MHPFSRFTFALLPVALAARGLAAQTPDTVATPTATPVVLAPMPTPSFPSASLTDAASWPRWIGSPLVFMTPSHVVLVTSPLSAAWISAHGDGQWLMGDCRDFISNGARVARGGPWGNFDSAAAGAPLIMIQIMPAMRRGRPSCQATAPPSPALAMSGSALLDGQVGAEYQFPTRAQLLIDNRPIAPVLYGRVPVKLLTRGSSTESRDEITQLRLYISADELAPDSLGRLPRVVVRVWGSDTTSAVDFPLPASTVRQLWNDFLPWRLERLSAVASAAPAPPLPAPSDPGLHTAWEHYGSGEFRKAALLTEERFHAAPLTRDDSLAGGVQLAYALLALRDTVGAGPAIRELMSDNPCLTLAPSAPPAYEERFDRVRPRARCDAAVTRTIVNGLIFPGYGQLSRGRPFGLAISATSAAALTFAAIRYSASRSAYDSYQDTPNSQSAVALYHDASRARRDARNSALAGIGIWLVGAAEAGIHALHHRSEIRRVRPYGVAPIARSDAGRTEIGLSLTF